MSAAVMHAGAAVYQEPGKFPSIVLAVLVHVLLAVLLFFGVRWQSREPDTVMVELWSAPVVEVKPEPQPAPEPEVKTEPQVEPPKPDIAVEKKKELKKEPPKKEERKLNFDRSKDIRAQLEKETAAIDQQQEKQRILDQMKRETAAATSKADVNYFNKIRAQIKQNIRLPENIPGNPEAIFDVLQLPTGDVISAKLSKSSGYKPYDDAVERAILKASPLPKPDRPEQFQRSLRLIFRPLD
jgi:colicin import membrane protein